MDIVVSPELPCNGCSRLGKAGLITWDKGYIMDITCRDCSIYPNWEGRVW